MTGRSCKTKSCAFRTATPTARCTNYLRNGWSRFKCRRIEARKLRGDRKFVPSLTRGATNRPGCKMTFVDRGRLTGWAPTPFAAPRRKRGDKNQAPRLSHNSWDAIETWNPPSRLRGRAAGQHRQRQTTEDRRSTTLHGPHHSSQEARRDPESHRSHRLQGGGSHI